MSCKICIFFLWWANRYELDGVGTTEREKERKMGEPNNSRRRGAVQQTRRLRLGYTRRRGDSRKGLFFLFRGPRENQTITEAPRILYQIWDYEHTSIKKPTEMPTKRTCDRKRKSRKR